MKIFSEKQAGLTSYVSFDRLIDNSIKEAVALRPNEIILGIYIEENGITVYLEQIIP